MPRACIAIVIAAAASGFAQTTYTVSTVAGTPSAGDGGRALDASFSAIEGIAASPSGEVYIADAGAHRIRRVSPAGLISTIAGTSSPGLSPDGVAAGQGMVNSPYGLSASPSGDLFFADLGNTLLRCITSTGLLRTVAGGGEETKVDGSIPAAKLQLSGPRNTAVGANGVVIVSDYEGHRVYRIAAGQAEVVAGTGVAGFDAEPVAAGAKLRFPAGVAVSPAGDIFIADSGNGVVRSVFGGRIATVLGPANGVVLDTPTGLAVDDAANLYVVDAKRKRIYRRNRIGDIRVIGAEIAEPRDVAVDSAGNVYAAEPKRVWRIRSDGTAVLFAGQSGTAALPEDAPAGSAPLSSPMHVSIDAAGSLYVTEEEGRRVRRISGGLIRTVAGPANLVDPVAAVADARGVLRVSDYAGNRILAVATDGKISTIAGDGTAGFRGDNGAAAGARVNRPRGLVLDRNGNLLFADSLNHRVRRIGVNGVISTIAGTGTRGFAGDGRLATQAQLDTPAGLFVDAAGVLYIADSGNHRIRRVAVNGTITTVAGNGAADDSGDGAPALQASLNFPAAVAMDPSGALLIADTFNHRIRRVGTDGVIDTIAGDGTPGGEGDGEPGTVARFRFPTAIAVDAAGAIYVADHQNHRVRKLTPVVTPPAPLLEEPLTLLHAATLEAGPFAAGQLVLAANAAPGTVVRVNGASVSPVRVGPDGILFRLPLGLAEAVVNGRRLALVAAAPGIFAEGGSGQAAAVNEDGTVNSEENPAARGSALTFYVTGEGSAAAESIVVTVGQAGAEVLFAGPAPGLPGVTQVNIKLPGIFTPPGVRTLTVSVGGVASQKGVTVVVR